MQDTSQQHYSKKRFWKPEERSWTGTEDEGASPREGTAGNENKDVNTS
jgi:hypothetical protein